jgi:arylsulfatase A-like enzyme
MELDWEVGEILKKIDDLGIANNTIVLFTSDNGAEIFTWPDGGNHPQVTNHQSLTRSQCRHSDHRRARHDGTTHNQSAS